MSVDGFGQASSPPQPSGFTWSGSPSSARASRVSCLPAFSSFSASAGSTLGHINKIYLSALVVLGILAVAILSSDLRLWTAVGIGYALAASIGSSAVRLDPNWGFAALMLVLLVVWATDIGGYFAGRLIGGPKTLAAGQPEEDLGWRDRRLCGKPRRRGWICGIRFRKDKYRCCCWAPFSRSPRSSAISLSPPSSAGSASRIPVTSFPDMAG